MKHTNPLLRLKTLTALTVFTALTVLTTCAVQEPAYSIHVTPSDACFVKLSLFDVNGIPLGFDEFDCTKAQFCIFNVRAMGTYILHADNNKKQQKISISVHQQFTHITIDI